MLGVTVQEQQRVDVPARAGRTAELYDFRRPSTLAREHARVLELAFETFARQWGTQLTATVRAMSQVTCEQVLMQPYDEYAASLPSATAMVLCAIQDSAAKAVIQFPTTAALAWVNSMLGGHGRPVAEERKFTLIEQALVKRLIDDALEDLRYSLGPVLARPIVFDAFQYNSQFAQAAATTDLMIVATFDIRVGETSTTATVAIPAALVLSQLGDANPIRTAEDAADHLHAHVAMAPVDVSLRLTPIMVRPVRILNLAVGDILRVPHPQHRPLELAVQGMPIARAAAGSNASRLACVVVDADF